MHLPDGLLTLPVSASLWGGAVASIGVAVRAAKRTLAPERLPLIGVLGAFVFAAQMLNFPIATGVSGHLAGGALLAIALGPGAAVLAMTAVLMVQCLLFADGGVLAFGANVMNMGVIAPLVATAVYRLLGDRFAGMAASASVLAAALAATLELVASRAVPLATFLTPMLALHALIAVVEGVATHAVLRALRGMRPEIFTRRLETT
ncbi:MAG: energy-coupling factor ABC transporter permease [Planctomycetes bacterium]|nr:energy-coupling factor ABC transporter permease [Planctomycetota bacterium]MBI3848348.1 energy-coupling factor ABC transporter permease [Planctomycetota bacterium]